MSLQSVAASARRASTTAREMAIARKGMFCMVQRDHRYTSLLHGAHAGWSGFTPGIVASVTRDGVVKEVLIVGQSWTLKPRDWSCVTVDSEGKIADPAGVAAKLVDERGCAIEYHDQGEAIAAIKAAAGIAGGSK